MSILLTQEQKEFLLLFRFARPAKNNVFRHYRRDAGMAAAIDYLSRPRKKGV
jgi:hypothetical protein